MYRLCWASTLLLLASLAGSQQAAPAASTCPQAPAVQAVAAGQNMFDDQQEADLGDAIAERFEQEVEVIHDDALNARLRTIGERVVQYLPANHFRFRFLLMDLPEVNAFSLPGGRIYVSRKLIASVRSDDEIAGIIGHELGHIVTHQTAIELTKVFRESLGVTQVGDRKDIFDKYHLMLDTWQRKPIKDDHKEEPEQYSADQVGLYVVARAGYAPQAAIDFWDRFNQTKGQTGNWFSDFLGTTKPEQKRLREMLKSMAAMPAGCANPATADPGDFQRWQAAVVAFQPGHETALLPGLISKLQLAQPLRPDLYHLRFSPDGKYLLAQDEGGIHVLSHKPLEFLFFIDAPDAYHAQFTPDSRSIVFHTASLRVERWSIEDRKQAEVHELIAHDTCHQPALSPDGKYLACNTVSYLLISLAPLLGGLGDLEPAPATWLMDVASGETVFRKKGIYRRNAFSPDGKYYVAGGLADSAAMDLQSKQEMKLPSSLRNAVRWEFAFVGSDRLVGVDTFKPAKSPVLQFPSGQSLGETTLSDSIFVRPVTRGQQLLVGPIKEQPLGLLDLAQNRLLIGSKNEALDVYDSEMVIERQDGEIALFEVGTTNSHGALALKQSRLGGLRAGALSADMNWLAISTKTRGAVWNLAENKREMYVAGYDGAWFGEDNRLFIDYPKKGDNARRILRLTPPHTADEIYTVDTEETRQMGPYLRRYSAPDGGKISPSMLSKVASTYFLKVDANLELFDYRKQAKVWTHHFMREMPGVDVNYEDSRALLYWPISTSAAKEEMLKFPELKNQAEKYDYLLELYDIQKDAPLRQTVLSTGKLSFTVEDTATSGDWAAVAVSEGRVLVYSMATGKQMAHMFGRLPKVSAAAGQVAVTTNPNELALYQLADGQLRQKYTFPAPVAFRQFSGDGKRLFVLTRDSMVYVLDVTASSGAKP